MYLRRGPSQAENYRPVSLTSVLSKHIRTHHLPLHDEEEEEDAVFTTHVHFYFTKHRLVEHTQGYT